MKAPDWLLANKVTIPYGRRGRAQVTRYKISAKRADEVNWRIVMHNEDRAWSYPGKYTGLNVDRVMVMSDEAKEVHDHLPFIERAAGRILITGLGLGVCLQALLRKPDVEHVTVVEECADVLHLVAPHYKAMFDDLRETFVHGDALHWRPPPGAHFDYAWHDIWPVAVGWFWPQHEHLYDRYAPYVAHQESWRADWMKARFEKEVAP